MLENFTFFSIVSSIRIRFVAKNDAYNQTVLAFVPNYVMHLRINEQKSEFLRLTVWKTIQDLVIWLLLIDACVLFILLLHYLDYSVPVYESICMCLFRWIKLSFRNTHFHVPTGFNDQSTAEPFYYIFWMKTKRPFRQMKLVVIWKFVVHNKSYN